MPSPLKYGAKCKGPPTMVEGIIYLSTCSLLWSLSRNMFHKHYHPFKKNKHLSGDLLEVVRFLLNNNDNAVIWPFLSEINKKYAP